MTRTILASLLLILLAAGCTGQSASSSAHNVVPTDRVDDSDSNILVIYGNKEFDDKLLVVRKMMDGSGRLAKCSVTLQNVSEDTFVVEYQFRWMEAGGMPVMQTPAWNRMTVPPKSAKPLVNMAKVPEARIVEFTIRLPLTAMYDAPKDKKKK